jgi:predicted nucleotidyltransferase
VHKRQLNKQLNLMVKRLVKRFDPEQIILFGSHARGTAQPDSDVDLLVILPVAGSKRSASSNALRCHIPVPKDIIVATPDQVRRQKNIFGTIIRPALREGKVLYARR